MTVRRLRQSGLALLCALVLASSALAQVARGTLYGRIADEQGGALPGVVVTLSGALGTRSTTADASGAYRMLNVDQGSHTLTVSLAGFASATRQVVVRTGDNVNIDFSLKIAAVQETVEVSAETPAVDPKKVGTATVIGRTSSRASPPRATPGR